MSFRPKIKNKIIAVLFAILPAFAVGFLVFGADVYYNLDTAKIMINQNNEITGTLK